MRRLFRAIARLLRWPFPKNEPPETSPYVGRIAGEDSGFGEPTGAEERTEHRRERGSADDASDG
jgi:hypothetical protein